MRAARSCNWSIASKRCMKGFGALDKMIEHRRPSLRARLKLPAMSGKRVGAFSTNRTYKPPDTIPLVRLGRLRMPSRTCGIKAAARANSSITSQKRKVKCQHAILYLNLANCKSECFIFQWQILLGAFCFLWPIICFIFFGCF